MLSNYFNLNIGKNVGCNDRILISKIDIKIGSNRNMKKTEVCHCKSKSPLTPMKEHFSHKMDLVKILDDKWKKDFRAFGNQNIIAEKHIGEKLVITF